MDAARALSRYPGCLLCLSFLVAWTFVQERFVPSRGLSAAIFQVGAAAEPASALPSTPSVSAALEAVRTARREERETAALEAARRKREYEAALVAARRQKELEIFDRLASLKVPGISKRGDLFPAVSQLLPDALQRWTCSQPHSAADEERLRKHPAMHNHLSGTFYWQGIINVVRWYKPQNLLNKGFLEIGYGIGLASAILRGFNVTLYATEIAPVPWTPLQHGPFFENLLELARAAKARGELGEMFDLDSAASYGRSCGNSPGIHELQTGLEELTGVPDRSIDNFFSMAVLEHISDPVASLKALARVSRPGAWGCHQVDQRDHRNWAKPWEFFLLSDEEFWRQTTGSSTHHPHFGNRVRLTEFLEAARLNGFRIVHLTRQHETATEEGLAYAARTYEKLSKLNPKTHRYAGWNREDFDQCTANRMPVTGILFCIRWEGPGPLPPDTEKPTCGVDQWSRSGFGLM